MTARHPPNTIPHLVWVQYIGIISVALGMLKYCEYTLKTPTLVHFRRERPEFPRVQRQKCDEFTSKISIQRKDVETPMMPDS